jgi:hypothetical protein
MPSKSCETNGTVYLVALCFSYRYLRLSTSKLHIKKYLCFLGIANPVAANLTAFVQNNEYEPSKTQIMSMVSGVIVRLVCLLSF